jgi:hypothetical protein
MSTGLHSQTEQRKSSQLLRKWQNLVDSGFSKTNQTSSIVLLLEGLFSFVSHEMAPIRQKLLTLIKVVTFHLALLASLGNFFFSQTALSQFFGVEWRVVKHPAELNDCDKCGTRKCLQI